LLQPVSLFFSLNQTEDVAIITKPLKCNYFCWFRHYSSSDVVWDCRSLEKIGLGLAGLVLCCETRSCHARRHHDLEGHSNFSSTII